MTTATTLTKRARIRQSEDAWLELVVCFEQSGQTREQFCSDQGLALSTFSRWRQRLRSAVQAAATPLAYWLQATLKQRARTLASGLTPRAVLEKFAAVQMVDVHLPTTDGRHLILSRYTQPEKDLQLLLDQLKLTLPEQPPPRIRSAQTLMT